jgi:glycosyltransferase involved in cell wall biosynthesis
VRRPRVSPPPLDAGTARGGPHVVRHGASSRHPPVLFVSWGAVEGRSAEIAAALGGTSLAVFPPVEGHRPPVAVRYALAAPLTVVALLRLAPRALVVTNPPVVLALIALGWSKVAGVPLALDSHPGSFGRQGDRASRLLLPLHRFVARRAAVCLVTCEDWVRVVESWGGRGIVLHESPGRWPGSPSPPSRPTAGGRPLVLFVTRFAGDEPVGAVVDAAAMLPGADFAVTGRLADLPGSLAAAAGPNVRFVGFLPGARYRELVASADVLLTLTSEPTSVMRAAYEAVYAGKPLVVSDWPLCRSLFPHAVHVQNEPAAVAAGLAEALGRLGELGAAAVEARATQQARFEGQIERLRLALGLVPGVTP